MKNLIRNLLLNLLHKLGMSMGGKTDRLKASKAKKVRKLHIGAALGRFFYAA